MSEPEITSETFNRLTEKQRAALGLIAIGRPAGAARATLDSLVQRGLIERDDRREGMFVIHDYSMPLHVHISWCQWCSEHYSEDEDA